MSGVAMAIGLAVLLGPVWPRWRWVLLFVGILYALAMALSRTYLRVHWLTDVAGGLVLGTTVVLVVVWALIEMPSGRPEVRKVSGSTASGSAV